MDIYSTQQLLASAKSFLDEVGYVGDAPKIQTNVLPEPPLLTQVWLTGKVKLDASQIADSTVLSQFTEAVKYVIAEDWSAGAFKLQAFMEDTLLPANVRLKTTNPKLYDQYAALVAVLKFLNLGAIGLPKAYELVGKYIVTALQWGIPLQDKLELRLEREDDFLLGGEVAQGFADALANSQVRFGNVTFLTPDSRQVGATIGSWIKEYIRYGQSTAEHKTGTLQRTEFLRKSKELQKLTPPERELLTKIFEIYDWIMYGGEDSDERLDVGLDEGELPVPSPSFVGRQSSGVRSSLPSVPLGTQSKPMPVPRPSQGSIGAKVVAPVSVPRPSVNVQELVNRVKNNEKPGMNDISKGVSLGRTPTAAINVEQMKRQIEQQRKQSQIEIDKKLQELKKRRSL